MKKSAAHQKPDAKAGTDRGAGAADGLPGPVGVRRLGGGALAAQRAGQPGGAAGRGHHRDARQRREQGQLQEPAAPGHHRGVLHGRLGAGAGEGGGGRGDRRAADLPGLAEGGLLRRQGAGDRHRPGGGLHREALDRPQHQPGAGRHGRGRGLQRHRRRGGGPAHLRPEHPRGGEAGRDRHGPGHRGLLQHGHHEARCWPPPRRRASATRSPATPAT